MPSDLLPLLETWARLESAWCHVSQDRVFMPPSAHAPKVCVYRAGALPPLGEAVILRAVLEAAAARGWRWSLVSQFDTSDVYLLGPHTSGYTPALAFVVGAGETPLEREILPRLACYVRALEALEEKS